MEKKTASDFRFGKNIGEGSFSTVYLAKEISSGKEYASEYQNEIFSHRSLSLDSTNSVIFS